MFSRTVALIGENSFNKLRKSHIVLCGCGGVGSYTFEALVRMGIGKITVIDSDTVSTSNINRQLIATADTVGMKKTEVAIKRAAQIGTDCNVIGLDVFLNAENTDSTLPKDADFIIDAIDFIPAKVEIALFAQNHNIPSVCCLGTGNRLNANFFEICDIYKTTGCPLARKMRQELRKVNIEHLDVLFSKAPVTNPVNELCEGKRTVGSVSFVPSVAGLLLAQHVIVKLMEEI